MWLKYATGVDTPILPKNTDLAFQKSNIIKLDIDTLVKVTSGWSNLKSKVSELNAHKLAPVPDDLSKLCQSKKRISLKSLNVMNSLRKLMVLRLLILVI